MKTVAQLAAGRTDFDDPEEMAEAQAIVAQATKSDGPFSTRPDDFSNGASGRLALKSTKEK